MKLLRLFATTSMLVLPLVSITAPAHAATAHNSEAGGIGQSTNPGASTVNSRRVKHAAKHAAATEAEPDRDAGMYIVKPQPSPEYFSHSTGSDGSSAE